MNEIHPTAIIGPSVVLGQGNTIGPYAVITGHVTIGDDNWIGSHVSIGAPAEIRGVDMGLIEDEQIQKKSVVIGCSNVIREGCVVHTGFFSGTIIADNCYIMNQVYIAHDCTIGNSVTLSSNVALGGHSIIQRGANLGMGAIVHQMRVIGAVAMIGMGSVVTRDVEPFSKAYGNPCRIHGCNEIGLQRAGYQQDVATEIVNAFRNKNYENLKNLVPTEILEFELARRFN